MKKVITVILIMYCCLAIFIIFKFNISRFSPYYILMSIGLLLICVVNSRLNKEPVLNSFNITLFVLVIFSIFASAYLYFM